MQILWVEFLGITLLSRAQYIRAIEEINPLAGIARQFDARIAACFRFVFGTFSFGGLAETSDMDSPFLRS
jgi:hypothetical protein